MRNTLVLIPCWFHRAGDEATLAIRLVHGRLRSDMCVVDFSSLLWIPMLKHIAQR
jgi:hypothetical protein